MQQFDHTYIYISIYFIMVCIAILIGIVIYMAISNVKHRKRLEEISKYSVHITADIGLNVIETLNIIIQDAFDDYKVKTLILYEGQWINSDKEDEIRKGLSSLVSSRISDAAIDKLSLIYRPENIASIIGDKIYITVMNYVINHNKDLELQVQK